ncbi:MAG: sigma-54 interaction domain-containing protein [Desulfonatronovibrionaceae bacterium]
MQDRSAVHEDSFFRQAVVRICGSLDIRTSMERCLYFLKEHMPAERLVLALYLPDMKMSRVAVSVYGEDSGSVFVGNELLPGHSWRDGNSKWPYIRYVRVINRPVENEHLREVARRIKKDLDFSLMVMRLELEGEYVGDVGVSCDGTERFTAVHARLFKSLREPFALALANALKHEEVVRLNKILADDNRYFQKELRERRGKQIIGANCGLRDVMNQVEKVAPTESPVLLLGETGSGKGLIANAIHRLSQKFSGPLVTVNCGAIPHTLLDSELFGHEKGAFTGAMDRKRGRFERADQGTIFLDEVGELPAEAQVRLLNVLQYKEIERVGGTKPVRLDIRIIAATNRNLQEMVEEGKFREDLWFRLNVFPVYIPPLRRRKEDIAALVQHFVERKSIELKLPYAPALTSRALELMKGYHWPGNVREMENLIERALIQSSGEVLEIEPLLGVLKNGADKAGQAQPDDTGAFPTLEEVNAEHIRRALKRSKGKISGAGGAADLLKINSNTLRQRMDKLGVAYKKQRRPKRYSTGR